jgi:hypothetical protein
MEPAVLGTVAFVGPVRYVGQNVVLRWWPPAMLVFAFVVLIVAGTAAGLYASVFALCGLVVAHVLPWRFAVVDDGIVLCFPFARVRFLPREVITIRISPGSAVASLDGHRRAWALSDGLVERRHARLRAVLVEHGFRVA